METIRYFFNRFRKEQMPQWDEGELTAIANRLLDHITHTSRLDRMTQPELCFTPSERKQWEQAVKDLKSGVPLQYITGSQWFLDRAFEVNPEVLIPRPETEELVAWIVEENAPAMGKQILDIGTGSGCIAISLKSALAGSFVTAIDISTGALETARRNAIVHQAEIDFRQIDFLNHSLWEQLPVFDVIVSNPPYIPAKEVATLETHVRDQEPDLALSVPDEDPLLFYRNIAFFSMQRLRNDGAVYCEIHKDYGAEVSAVFRGAGFSEVLCKKDMQGNDRMIKAANPVLWAG